MMTGGAIVELFAAYRKHGWTAFAVLSSKGSASLFGEETAELFAACEKKTAGFDAVWFRRRSRGGSVAYELRHLSSAPFAMLEVIGPDTIDSEVENILRGVEERMAGYVADSTSRPASEQ